MASRLEWVIAPEAAWMANYEAWVQRIGDAVMQAWQKRQTEIVNWMKTNHPWKNRTRIAEEGLFGEIIRDGAFIIFVIGHDQITYYSRFLERFMSPVAPGISKWSVLAPALDYWGPILVRDVQEMFT